MRTAAVIALALGACGDDDSNAQTLWLASNGSEVRVHLVEDEPDPY